MELRFDLIYSNAAIQGLSTMTGIAELSEGARDFSQKSKMPDEPF